MLTPETRLQLNDRELVAKVIDREAIIINLASGVYYSLDRAGAFIWELMLARHALGDIASAVTEQYEVTAERAKADVMRLSAQLLDENMVAICAENGVTAPRPSPPRERSPYEPPALDIFRDIGHLVALDPPMPGLKDLPWKGGGEGSSS